jgi:hypothetical protein
MMQMIGRVVMGEAMDRQIGPEGGSTRTRINLPINAPDIRGEAKKCLPWGIVVEMVNATSGCWQKRCSADRRPSLSEVVGHQIVADGGRFAKPRRRDGAVTGV